MSLIVSAHIEMDDDIIEDIEFSTMKVTGVEPTHKMQKLIWDQKVRLQCKFIIVPLVQMYLWGRGGGYYKDIPNIFHGAQEKIPHTNMCPCSEIRT